MEDQGPSPSWGVPTLPVTAPTWSPQEWLPQPVGLLQAPPLPPQGQGRPSSASVTKPCAPPQVSAVTLPVSMWWVGRRRAAPTSCLSLLHRKPCGRWDALCPGPAGAQCRVKQKVCRSACRRARCPDALPVSVRGTYACFCVSGASPSGRVSTGPSKRMHKACDTLPERRRCPCVSHMEEGVYVSTCPGCCSQVSCHARPGSAVSM